MIRSFSSLSARSLLLVPALLGLALAAAAGCSDGSEDPVQGPTQVDGLGDLNSSSQAVSLANLQFVNGTYGVGCTSRSGSWSLPLAGYGGLLDNAALSVVTNDAACTLTVTGIKASGTLFSATPVIPLGTNFAGSASIFQSAAIAAGLSTFAGNGTNGNVDGPSASAQFGSLQGIASDGAGNIYASDMTNGSVRKITPGGVVSTLASGFGGGLRGIAADAAGNVYATDVSLNRIAKILPNGSISTLANINTPVGVTVDNAGNLYVSTHGVFNVLIHKVTPAGAVSTYAGNGNAGFADGAAASAQFNGPSGLAVDAGGNVYVADSNNNRIRKITPGGVVSTLAGGSLGYADGTGASAQFSFPIGLGIDASGNLYVGDSNNSRIRKVTPAGVTTTLAGNGTNGFADGNPGQIHAPNAVVTNPAGDIFIADGGNFRVRKISANPTPGELFYGNAKVNTTSFASNFVVNLLLSDDPGTASATNTAIFASVTGSSQTDLVAPPNYTPSTAGLSVQVDVNRVVTAISGNLLLTDGSNTGSGYVVNLDTLPASPTFTEYDTAYNAGSAVAIGGANPTVPGSSLLAPGVQLPATRTVIVRRSQNGVIAYQAVKVTFNGP